MAIIPGTAAAGTCDAVTSTSFSVDVGAEANRLLVVGVGIANAGVVSALTYNGVAMTFIDVQVDGTSSHKLRLYYLVAPASGSNTLAYTQNDTWSRTIITALPFSGVDQVAPLGTAAKASGTTSDPTVDVSSAAGELVVDCVHSLGTNETATLAPGTSQTEQIEQKSGFYTSVMDTEAGATTVTMNHTSTLMVAWAQIGVSLKAAATGRASKNTKTHELGMLRRMSVKM